MTKEKQKTESETNIETDTSSEVSTDNDEKRIYIPSKKKFKFIKFNKEFESEQLKKQLPEIYVGDTVKVGVRITEGNKERVQPLRRSCDCEEAWWP